MAGNLILIIDDDPDQHLILDKYLTISGYRVVHAEDGDEGLRLLEQEKPDLVLLDVQMPGKDGFQVLGHIKRKAANRDISVLMLTALDRRHLKIKGLELGADDYITKPFDRAELLARINAVLRRSHRHRRLEGIMEGDLSDVGLSDLLQSMELGLKTATITLEHAHGQIVVENGELLHTKQGRHTGDQALIRLFLLEKGYFSIAFNETPKNIPGSKRRPLMSVLMSVSNEVDEIKYMISRLKIGDRKIKVVGDTSSFPALDIVGKADPMTMIEMITEMDGHPAESIKLLITASKKQIIKIEK